MLPINDSNRVFYTIPDSYHKEDYSKIRNKAFALVKVISEEEVISLVNYANEFKHGIIAVGANTGLAGATYITGNEILIDFSLMDSIHGLDEETMTLSVDPGVTLEAIQKYVEEKHYFYPPDPGSKNSTIGGNVATNAGGMRAVKYGVTRDYVKELTVILADGSKMVHGSLNLKDSSGYDLKDLFIGSEGTLGITTHIKLKVIPLPHKTKTYLAAFESITKACQAVSSILQLGIDPTAVEFFERDMVSMAEEQTKLKLPTDKGQSFLLMTLDGDALEERETLLEKTSYNKEAIDFIALEDAKDVWKLRDHLLSAVVSYSEQITMDETVPTNKVAEIYEYTKELEEKYGLQLMSFGHAGDGNLHTCILRGDIQDDQEWIKKKDLVLDELYHKIKELGGLPSAEHGIGMIKKDHFDQVVDPQKLKYMRAIKSVFDPHNILNPHKVI